MTEISRQALITALDGLDAQLEAARLSASALRTLIEGAAPGEPPAPAPDLPEGWLDFSGIDAAIYPDSNVDFAATWARDYGVSSWDDGAWMIGQWVYAHVIREGNGLTLISNAAGHGQLQHHKGRFREGRIGVLADIGRIRPDGVVAPLWTYTGWQEGQDGSGRFEFDYEIAGRKELQINYHDGIQRPNGPPSWRTVHTIPGDWSNRRVRFEIDYSESGGYADFLIDGESVYRLTRAEVEGWGMQWPDKPMFTLYHLWVVNNPGWTGAPYSAGNGEQRLTLLQRLYAPRAAVSPPVPEPEPAPEPEPEPEPQPEPPPPPPPPPPPSSGTVSSQTAFHTDDELAAARASFNAAKLSQLLSHANDTAAFQTLPSHLHVVNASPNRELHDQQSALVSKSGKHIYINALLYQMTGDRQYADRAIHTLMRWVNTVTSISRWEHTPLRVGYALSALVKGYGLVKGLMPSEDQQKTNQWLTGVLLPRANGILYKSDRWQSSWVSEVPPPTNTIAARNNWQCWGTLTCALIYDVTGNTAGLAKMREHAEYLIRETIDPTHFNIGTETYRKDRGLWYSYFTLAPLTAAMKVLRDSALGADLFAPAGKVERALDRLFFWCANPAEYPYWGLNDTPPIDYGNGKRWPQNLIAAARIFYPSRNWPAQSDAFYVDHHYAWAAPLIVPPRGSA